MDGSTPQTVAQAVQAATQQAQQAASQPSPVQAPQTTQSSTIDNLTCQWQGCGERCDNAEALYDHVCERHVGRKSTNNLNLTCQWGACRTTTVKRDHITSHIRVHVPLKPHKCDFCGKAFKRPQDLKKHVKTHADDSVLMNSPQHGQGRSASNGGMGQQNGKPTSYYGGGHDTSMGNPYPSYQPGLANGAGAGSYPGPAGNQYAGYGSVSYPNSSALADIQSMDTRRRAIEALNDFLGDIKRRAIDPTNYYDVGHRLQGNSLPLPVGTGYNTGYNNSGYSSNFNTASLLESFNQGTGMGGGGGHGGVATQGYSLPLPNARTKNDLQDIDRFLEQLQATVYETSKVYENGSSAAAAGVQQPGVHSHFTGDFGVGQNQNQYRSSNSPPNFQHHLGGSGLGSMSNSSSMQGVTSSSSALDTPALTPASVSSYTSSGHSPMSSHSRASFGSVSGNMYPNLPAVTGMSDLGSNYPTTTSAPASGLASGFEGLDGRRYSGGRLQRQAPPAADQDTEMADADDGSRTPKAADAKRPNSKGNSSIDPALRGEDEKSSDSASTPAANSEGEDKRQEEWVENIRVIEALRKWIGDRLKTGDYDETDKAKESKEGETKGGASDEDVDMKTVAKLVAERLASANAETETKQEDGEVKYPSLPTAA